MDGAKYGREHDCRRPEADSIAKRRQGIAAKQKFFRKPNHKKCNGPHEAEVKCSTCSQDHAAEIKAVAEPNSDQQDRQSGQSDARPDPEVASKCSATGQSVITEIGRASCRERV